MTCKRTNLLSGAVVVLAFALAAPAVAVGELPAAAGPPERVLRHATPSTSVAVVGVAGVDRRATPQRLAPTRPGDGLGWREAAVGAGIMLGILALGLWGDLAVGGLILGASALVTAGATLFARASALRSRSGAPRRQRRTAAWRPVHGRERR